MAAQTWTFQVGEANHVVAIEPDNPLKGWPDAFVVDGVRHPIKIRPSLTAIRFEQPLEVDGHSASFVMSKVPRREAYGPRFRATLKVLLTLRIWRLSDALHAVDPWRYDLLVDGWPVPLQPTDPPGGKSG